jgi:hypothetical protein
MSKTSVRPYAERIAEAPALYLGREIPAEVAAAWKTWEGAEYRRSRWIHVKNAFNVPDQRFGVLPLPGMCADCLEDRRKWRDMQFRGASWPHQASFDWHVMPERGLYDRRRVEWDEKCIEMMQRDEQWCLAGLPRGRRHVPRTCLVHAVSPAYCPCGWPCLEAAA